MYLHHIGFFASEFLLTWPTMFNLVSKAYIQVPTSSYFQPYHSLLLFFDHMSMEYKM